MNEVLQTIKNRRSVREFKSDPIRKEDIEIMVEAGTYAPSGHNQQPWLFIVIQDREMMYAFSEECKAAMSRIPVEWIKKTGSDLNLDLTHGAPVLVIIASQKRAVTGRTDCTAAMENMLLAAESLGISSCWMSSLMFIADDRGAIREFGVPDGYLAQQAAVFGYMAEGCEEEKYERRTDVVNYIGEF